MIGTLEFIGKCPNCKHDIFEDNKYASELDVLITDGLFRCPVCKQVYCIYEIEKANETHPASEVLNYLCDIMGCNNEFKIKEDGDEDDL